MKTTLNIHDALLMQAKVFAAREDLTLTRLIEEGLRMRLRVAEVHTKSKQRAMPQFKKGTGLAVGLGGLSTRELMDAADRVD